MIFEIKCWIARKIGGLSGWICGFLSGMKLGHNGYNDDTANYIFEKIHNKNVEKWEEKEQKLIEQNPKIGLIRILIHGFKADFEAYKEVCAEIESNKSKWR